MTTLQQLVQSYRHYESQYFRTHPQHDSYLYGEVAFCLMGLKPTVLVDFPGDVLAQYMTAVIDPWLQAHHDDNQGVLLRVVHRQLRSPELDSAQAVVFLVNTTCASKAMHGDDEDWRRLLRLLLVREDRPSPPPLMVIEDEDDLARLLDYPGRLPRSADELDTMHEVAYYDQPTQTVLTTFAAQLDQHAHVQHHFRAYRDAVAPMGIDLGLIFRRPTI
ncbi:hypothetical protein BCR42DRAFT_429143, partial [Absidia repens]